MILKGANKTYHLIATPVVPSPLGGAKFHHLTVGKVYPILQIFL